MFQKELEIKLNKTSKAKLKIGIDNVIGNVNYHYDFRSNFVSKNRTIIVWLPPSYKKEKEKHYPVLYMHDGQNVFDPKTSYVGFDWRADETVTKLIKQNKIEEIIIVAIYNTSDRLDEYSDCHKGENYLKFIIYELVPFIDINYRTIRKKENTAVMGSSMGGLSSLLMVLKHFDYFSKAACLSSSFYFGNNKIFKLIDDYNFEKKHLKIYFDCGEDGKKDAQRMFSSLISKGLSLGEDFDFFYDKGAVHSETAWANRLERPLLFLFGKKN